LRKSRIKAKIKLLVLTFAFIGIIMIAGNISLAVNRDAIDQGITGYFENEISVGPVFYVFPNRIILKDIAIQKGNLPLDRFPLIFPKASVSFLFWDFLFDGEIHISNVTLYPSKVSYYALSQFLEDNAQKILEIIRNSSGNNIKVQIKETLLDFDRKGNPDYIAMEFSLAIQKDFIEGAGYFRADQYDFTNGKGGEVQRTTKGWPLWYKWQGKLKSNGVGIDHFILKSDSMYSKLWGSVHSGLMKVNGFMFMDTTIQNSSSGEFSLSRYLRNFSTDNEMPNIDVYVLDIDGRINFDFPRIAIDRFNFALNNIPVTMSGDISLLDFPTLNADVSFRHPQSNKSQDIYFEKADVHLTSTWQDKVLNTDGRMDIDFIEHGDLGFSPQKAQIIFSDLQFHFDRFKRVAAYLSKGDITYQTKTSEHRIIIENFKSLTDTKKEGLKITTFHTPFYDGSLDGEIRFDTTRIPSLITSHVALHDVDTDTLEEFLVHFAKFNGRMSSTMVFTNVPQLDLSGEVTISDGQMTDFNFFNWVADTFRLPALKAIDFKKATAQFSINKENIQIHDIRLRTKDVDIGGYFSVDHQNLVSSEITLAFSQELLGESPKFKSILTIFDEDNDRLDFDFRLSGNVDTMNFQWVPSEVKKKIQTRIPDFIERKIERNIDSLMD